jgi:hypothetical protein
MPDNVERDLSHSCNFVDQAPGGLLSWVAGFLVMPGGPWPGGWLPLGHHLAVLLGLVPLWGTYHS